MLSSGQFDDSDDSSDSDDSPNWINWFCGLKGNDFFLVVDEEFVRDYFNLYGLRGMVHYFDHALEMILDPDGPDEDDLNDSDYREIYKDASILYGLTHARFCMSQRGLQLLKEKYIAGEYGQCPRSLCHNQNCLPVGLSDEPRKGSVRIYCPRCEQVYAPRTRNVNIDGAYFGTSLPHMFLQNFPELLPVEPPEAYIPRIFGFKIHNHRSVIQTKLDNEAAGIRLPRPENFVVQVGGLDDDDANG